ncbi:hypothetical protein BVX97_02675 [bacterium E08(2017)]|nr:hypothetical protein BVX97_02675 [bacterium E08(2017)]
MTSVKVNNFLYLAKPQKRFLTISIIIYALGLACCLQALAVNKAEKSSMGDKVSFVVTSIDSAEPLVEGDTISIQGQLKYTVNQDRTPLLIVFHSDNSGSSKLFLTNLVDKGFGEISIEQSFTVPSAGHVFISSYLLAEGNSDQAEPASISTQIYPVLKRGGANEVAKDVHDEIKAFVASYVKAVNGQKMEELEKLVAVDMLKGLKKEQLIFMRKCILSDMLLRPVNKKYHMSARHVSELDLINIKKDDSGLWLVDPEVELVIEYPKTTDSSWSEVLYLKKSEDRWGLVFSVQ